MTDVQNEVLGNEVVMFDDYKYPDLIKQIHTNNQQRKQKIGQLLTQMSGLVTDLQSAMTLSTIIMDLLKLTIANDNQLIQVAKVIQKYVASINASKRNSGQQMNSDFSSIFDEIQAITSNSNNLNKDLSQAVQQITQKDLLSKAKRAIK